MGELSLFDISTKHKDVARELYVSLKKILTKYYFFCTQLAAVGSNSLK